MSVIDPYRLLWQGFVFKAIAQYALSKCDGQHCGDPCPWGPAQVTITWTEPLKDLRAITPTFGISGPPVDQDCHHGAKGRKRRLSLGFADLLSGFLLFGRPGYCTSDYLLQFGSQTCCISLLFCGSGIGLYLWWAPLAWYLDMLHVC